MQRAPVFAIAVLIVAASCERRPDPGSQAGSDSPVRTLALPSAAVAPAPVSTSPTANPTPRPAPVTTAVSRVSQSELRSSIRPRLRGRQLAHRVYSAEFGPSGFTNAPTAVVLTRSPAARLGGFALSDGVEFPFPPLQEDGILDRVAAVTFVDVDGDADREVLAIVETKEESEQPRTDFFNVVLDWDAELERFVRLDRIEGEIEDQRTVAGALARLDKLTPR